MDETVLATGMTGGPASVVFGSIAVVTAMAARAGGMPAALPLGATWPFGVFFTLLGLCVGSFLNVCIHRLPAGKGLVWPGSHCPVCLAPIAWYDNVPVLSYFVLRGRCRRCGSRFSVRYMLVEAATGLVFLGYWLAYFRLGVRAGADHLAVYAVHMVLASALLASGVIDYERKEIYTSVTNTALAVGLVASLLWPEVQRVGAFDGRLPDWTGWPRADAVLLALVGAAVGAGILYLTRALGTLVFRKEAMGIGDVYLMAAVGACLGWEAAILVFFAAPFLGLVYGVWHLARKRGSEVPYGPFLGMAAGIIMLVQDDVVAYFRPGIEALVFG
ncbi:MAG: prepilin peptidase [Planctomycetota bacterium]|nr:prepilin peptidase [Planctomycetota bacterium]